MLALGGHPYPLQLSLQGLGPLAVGLLLHGKTLCLLLEPLGVVPLPWDPLSPVQLQYPAGHVVQEVPVVGNRNNRALVLLQMPLQPCHRFRVEVVGGLIQQKDVRLLQKQPAKGHPAPFTAGKLVHHLFGVGAAEGLHCQVQPGVKVPAVGGLDEVLQLRLPVAQLLVVGVGFCEGKPYVLVLLKEVHQLLNALGNDLSHRLAGLENGFLLKHAGGEAGGLADLPHDLGIDSCDDPEECGFP